MKIAGSDIALNSHHRRAVERQVDERLRFWTGARPPDNARGNSNAGMPARPAPVVFERPTPPPHHPTTTASSGTTGKASAEAAAPAAEADADQAGIPPQLQVLARMIELLTGTQVRVIRPRDLHADTQATDIQPPPASAPSPETSPGWGLEYDRVVTHQESESTWFSAQGTIRTTDGRQIRFDLKLAMQHVHTETDRVSLRAGNAVLKDPLVLHFDSALPELTQTRVAFDLDADGHTEQMPFVGPGSGFLVLDLNSNGRVDDGRELFGALSGDGFADLARHDDDHNGWIDENDAVFGQLRLWLQDAQGRQTLAPLAARNVGALHLGQTGTPHTLRADAGAGAMLGAVRASGLYLSENGEAGAMQQIDLLV